MAMDFAKRLLGALRPRQGGPQGPSIEDVQKAVIADGDDDAAIRELLAQTSADLNAAGLGEVLPVMAMRGTTITSRNNATYPLVLAALEHKPRRLKALLDAGASIDVRTALRKTPLHWAIKGERDYVAGEWGIAFRLPEDQQAASLACTRLLLEWGADPNAADGLKRTPLHYACLADGKLEHLQQLVARGADVDARTSLGETPLTFAAALNRLEAAIALVEAGANVQHGNQKGQTPLHIASLEGHAATAQLLLRRGADPNMPDGAGETPSSLAIRSGSLKTLRNLLESGASAELPAGWEIQMLLHALASRNTETLEALIEAMDINAPDATGLAPWHHAIGQPAGMPESAIAYLLDHGASHAALCSNRAQALHLACEHGKTAIVELLLSRGADIEHQNVDGYRPLHCGAQAGHLAVVQLLLERGADPMAAAGGLRTPLSLAVVGKHDALVDPLLVAVEAKGGLGMLPGYSPLHMACEGGSISIVEKLLRGKPDMEPRTDDGWTPLLAAIGQPGDTLVKMLLAAGANPNAPSEAGYRPLHRAAAKGRLDLLHLLIKHGADPKLPDISGSTLRAFAESSSNQALIAEVAALLPAQALAPPDVTARVLHVFQYFLARAPRGLQSMRGSGLSPITFSLTPWVITYPGITTGFVALYQQLEATFGEPKWESSAGWIVEALSWVESAPDKHIQKLSVKLADGSTRSIEVDVTACAPPAMRNQTVLLHRLVSASVPVWAAVKPAEELRGDTRNPGRRGPTLAELCDAVAEPGDDPSLLRSLLSASCPDLASGSGPAKISEQPLLIAAAHAKPNRLKVLLDAGANVTVHDGGVTALHYAARTISEDLNEAIPGASLQCARHLIAAHADVDAKTSNGRTPLHEACLYPKKVDHVRLLLSSGAHVDAMCISGWTPLVRALMLSNLAVAEVLIDAGADVNLADSGGTTPLLAAMRTKSEVIVAKLLEAGADATRGDRQGITPLQIAKADGLGRILVMLKLAASRR